ncbi:MAG: transglutaminase domain-containing protein [Clostridia bacterium]|nr:transglutaminase domain-containing protein [Clostridia bacterium]
MSKKKGLSDEELDLLIKEYREELDELEENRRKRAEAYAQMTDEEIVAHIISDLEMVESDVLDQAYPIPDCLHLETRYYYSTLTFDEKELYRFMVLCYLDIEPVFNYAYSEDIIPKTKKAQSLPTFIYDIENPVEIAKVFEAIIWDWPELYYVTREALSFVPPTSIVIADGKLQYTKREIKQINKRLEEIIHIFDGIEDPFELELAVHDYILKSFDYDDTDRYEGREDDEMFTVVSLVKKGKGVCAALTRMAQLILQRHGIPVANIIADSIGPDGSRELHSWLAVKIGDSYYHLDITANECMHGEIEYPPYKSFNLTDEEVMKNSTFSHEKYPTIVCNSTEYNYYHRRGLYFRTLQEIENGVKSFARDKVGKTGHHFYYFRTPKDLNERECVNMIYKAILDFSGVDASYLCDEGYFTVRIEVE